MKIIDSILSHVRAGGMLYKEFKLLIKRKKAPFLILSLPFILLLIYSAGSSALSNPSVTINVGVCNQDPEAVEFINSLSGNFNTIFFNTTNCSDKIKSEVRKGNILIGIVIRKGFVDSLRSGKQASITYYVDDSKQLTASMSSFFLERGFNSYIKGVASSSEEGIRTMASDARKDIDSAVVMLNATSNIIHMNKGTFGLLYPLIDNYLDSALSSLSAYESNLSFMEHLSVDFLTRPVVFRRESVYDNVNSASFNFASVFVIISLFTLLLLSSNSIIFDRKTNYITRIKASRTWLPTYLLSKLAFYWTISFVQFGIVLLLMVFQGAIFNFNLASLFASFSAVVFFNSSLGLLIGALSNNDNEAILFSLTISLPFLFLSGVFFPLDFMPPYIRFLGNVVPVNSEILLLKEASVLAAPLSSLGALLSNVTTAGFLLILLTYFFLRFRN